MCDQKCIFCKICSHTVSAVILHEDDEYLVLEDIKPAAKHHYLVIPRKHVKGPNILTKDDLPMLEKMHELGKKVLREAEGNEEDALLGFHWPPFNSVGHLHLHVISPTSDMSFWHRQIFKPDSFWFATIKYMYQRLSKL